MIAFFAEMFSYPFMRNALAVGLAVSVVSALLGIHLVLKRYSMIGDGLSHVGFGALAIGSLLGVSPLLVAVPVVTASSFLILRMSSNARVKGDASVALLSTGALAVGVSALSLFGPTNVDLNGYLFGSLFAVSGVDVVTGLAFCLVCLILYIVFFPRIFAVTFDETFAAANGLRAGAVNSLLAVMTSLTVVIGMRMMGTLLISALIIFPPLTAMRLCKTFRATVIVSVCVAVFSFLSGLLLTYLFPLQPGSCMVCVNLAVFGLFTLAGKLTKRS